MNVTYIIIVPRMVTILWLFSFDQRGNWILERWNIFHAIQIEGTRNQFQVFLALQLAFTLHPAINCCQPALNIRWEKSEGVFHWLFPLSTVKDNNPCPLPTSQWEEKGLPPPLLPAAEAPLSHLPKFTSVNQIEVSSNKHRNGVFESAESSSSLEAKWSLICNSPRRVIKQTSDCN